MRSLRARDLNVDYSCKNDVDASLGSGKAYDAVKPAKAPTKESAEPKKSTKKEQSQGKENERRLSGEGSIRPNVLSEQPKVAKAKPAETKAAEVPKQPNKRKSMSPTAEKVSPKEAAKSKKASKSPEEKAKVKKSKPSPKQGSPAPLASPAEPAKHSKKKTGSRASVSPVGSPIVSAVSSLFSLAGPTLPESPPIQKLPSPPAAAKQVSVSDEKAQGAKKKRTRDPTDTIDTSKDSSAAKKAHQIKQSFATEQKLLGLLDEKDKKYTELQKRLDAAQESHEQQTALLIAELQKDAEAKAKVSEDLIEHQKKEIARLKKRIQGSTGADVDEEEQKMAKMNQQLTDNNEVLKGEIIQLHKKWTSAQRKLEDATSEVKALRAELQAAVEAKEEALKQAARAADTREQGQASASGAATPARSDEADFDNTRIIEAYQMMFATRVTINPNGSAHCKTVNRKSSRVVEFDMVLGDEEVEYLPTRLDVGSAPLPEYMRDSISFRPVDTAEFMKNMLAAVFHKGQAAPQPESPSQ